MRESKSARLTRALASVGALWGLSMGCMTGCGSKAAPANGPRPLAQAGNPNVLLDQTEALAETDTHHREAFADHYEVVVTAGTPVSIDLTSEAFDPLLELTTPEGDTLSNDDWQAARNRSRIEFTPQQTGVMKIYATSFTPGATGAYRLLVEHNNQPAPAAGGVASTIGRTLVVRGAEVNGQLTQGDGTNEAGAWMDELVVPNRAESPSVLRVEAVTGQPGVIVWTPSGHTVAPDAQGNFVLSAEGAHRVQVVAAAPGQAAGYTANVRSNGGEAQVQGTSSRDHHQAPTAGTPQPVQPGQVLSAELGGGDIQLPSGETADLYAVNLASGQQLTIQMQSQSIDSYLMVLGPGGITFENDDFNGTRDAQLTLGNITPGSYRIVATTYRSGETGPYELKVIDSARGVVQPGTGTSPSIAANPPATPAGPGLFVRQGDLAQGDRTLGQGEFVDEYQVPLVAGQRVRIELSSQAFDTYVAIRGPDGNTEHNDDISDQDRNSALEFTPPTSAAYTVFATSYGRAETGRYELRVSPLGAAGTVVPPTQPPPVAPQPAGGQSFPGSLAQGDQQLPDGRFVDTHTVQLAAGQATRFGLTSSDFDTYLIVRPPSGAAMENDDIQRGNTNSAVSVSTPVAGTYTVQVTSYRQGMVGSYQLTVGPSSGATGGGTGGGGSIAVGPTPTGPAPTSLPQAMSGNLAQGDSTARQGAFADEHSVRFPVGQSVRVELSSSDFDTYLLVNGPNGLREENDDVSGSDRNSAVEIPVTANGNYNVTVTSYRPGDTGNYSLSFTPGTPVPSAGGTVASGRVWGVFTGISDYPGNGNDLPECANDAVKLAEVLEQQGLVPPNRRVLLTDSQVTVDAMRNALRQMASQVGPNDTFMFFFSGHGGVSTATTQDPRELDNHNEYLVLFDGNLEDDELGTLFDGVQANLNVAAIDACFSGGFAKDLITRAGRVGYFSSEEDVTSAVAGRFQAGGYLSHFLRTGIAGAADTEPQDQRITVGELSQFLRQQFGTHVRDVRMSEGYQNLVVDRGAVSNSRVLWSLGR